MDYKTAGQLFSICLAMALCGCTPIRIGPNEPVVVDKGVQVSSVGAKGVTYIFRLDSFEITNIRSSSLDTDVIAFSVKVGDRVFGPIVKRYGDVGLQQNGNPKSYSLGTELELGPIDGITDAT